MICGSGRKPCGGKALLFHGLRAMAPVRRASARIHSIGRSICLYRTHEQQKTFDPAKYTPEFRDVRDAYLRRAGKTSVKALIHRISRAVCGSCSSMTWAASQGRASRISGWRPPPRRGGGSHPGGDPAQSGDVASDQRADY